MNTPLSWPLILREALGFPESTPAWILSALNLFLVYALVIFPVGLVMAFLDRKLAADFQARIGPNRAGPYGAFQPFADLLKLLQKEGRSEWTWREAIWLAVHTMALYSTVAVMPLGSLGLVVNTDMSAFLPFWAALVLALGTMLLGFSQGSVPGWFGGARVAAQALAGAFPALVCVLSAGVRAGEFRWSVLAESQGANPLSWTAVSSPFQFIAFVVFVMSGMVLLGLPPMEAGLSTPDIHGGVLSRLSGRRLSLFRLGRFYGFFLWSVIAVVVFLGAWVLPFGISGNLLDSGNFGALQGLEIGWLLAKTLGLMLLISGIARVTPRARIDQITDFSWKVLSPFALLALLGSALWAGWEALL